MRYAVLLISSALLSFLFAYPVRSVALRFGVVDHPEKRKMHQIPVPLMGGLGIALSFFVVLLMVAVAEPALLDAAGEPFIGLLAGAVIILALGIYDDTRGLGAPIKFAVQTIAALTVIAFGGGIERFTNPLGSSFQLGFLGIPLAVIWIVGVTNAVNLIDGLDGLAAGVGGIAALGLFAVALPTSPFVAGLMIILAGACLGFLRHNFYPARMFLGDTGSMFIGFMLAVIGMHGSLKATTATVLFLPIIVLGIPIFDTLFAIVRRASRRDNPFKADREHIHHRLVRIGLHHRNVVLVLYFACVYLALTAYSIAQFPYQTALVFLVLLTMGGIIGLRTLRFIEERLEAGIAAGPVPVTADGREVAARARNGRKSNGSRRPARFMSLICEVGGFREDFGDPIEMRSLCVDISAMLSRRVKVLGVRAELAAPGRIVLIVRCEPLRDPMVALVKDGISWYLEDHRNNLSSGSAFPAIHWIRSGPTADPEDAGGAETAGSGDAAPLRLKGPAGLASG